METKEEPKKETKIENPDETHIVLGDIEIHSCEGLNTTYNYLLALLENESVKNYLERYELKKAKEKGGYVG